jgi:hypothetical protein
MPSPAEESQAAEAVPPWEQLPDYAQADLAACGCDAAWFGRYSGDATMRLTVLNLYVKLRGLDLWRHVGSEQDSQAGCLHFMCPDVGALKAALRARGDFTNPGASVTEWESRERRAEGALHFKHFTGWPEGQVQAHIDPYGLLLQSELWWLVPVVPLGQMIRHGADPTGYAEVHKIRALLLRQGWDPAPLTGRR